MSQPRQHLPEAVPSTHDVLVVPVPILMARIEYLQSLRHGLDEFVAEGLGKDVLAAMTAQIKSLEALIEAARASADDLLTIAEAERWSGLAADSLRKNYPSTGSGSGRRWRRGDLSLRSPYGSATGPEDDPLALRSSTAVELTNAAAMEVGGEDEQELIARALEESFAA